MRSKGEEARPRDPVPRCRWGRPFTRWRRKHQLPVGAEGSAHPAQAHAYTHAPTGARPMQPSHRRGSRRAGDSVPLSTENTWPGGHRAARGRLGRGPGSLPPSPRPHGLHRPSGSGESRPEATSQSSPHSGGKTQTGSLLKGRSGSSRVKAFSSTVGWTLVTAFGRTALERQEVRVLTRPALGKPQVTQPNPGLGSDADLETAQPRQAPAQAPHPPRPTGATTKSGFQTPEENGSDADADENTPPPRDTFLLVSDICLSF